jgi:hypothetical protein
MTNAENRYLNNNMPENKHTQAQTNKYFISQCLKAYINGNDNLFNTFSIRTQELVKSIYNAAISGNNPMLDQLLNRIEGKVKETIDLTTSIKSLQPTQEEQQALDNRFKIKPISIKVDSIKTLPEPFNDEQIDSNADYIVDTIDNSVNTQLIAPIQDASKLSDIQSSKVDKKTDTFPGDCQGNACSIDNNTGQDQDNWYDKTPHLVYRNT